MAKPAKDKRAGGEGTVRQRSDGTAEARLPGRGGKSFYGPTPEIAVARRAKYLENLRGGMPADATKATVAEYFGLWLENSVRVNVRRATYDHHKRIFRNHIAPDLGRLRLRGLTAEHVQALHARKFDAGFALSTRRHVHTTLSAGLKHAVRFGHLPYDVSAAVRVPKGDAAAVHREDLPDPDMHALDAGQVRTLLETSARAAGRYHALYVLALTSGMRQGEILGLPWRNLDLKNGVVRVLQTLVREDGRWAFPKPKTERSRRSVELRAEAVDALREHRKAQLEERMRYDGVWRDKGLVFPTIVGSPTARQNLARRSFKPLLKEAGLPGIRFHDMRHTFATLMLQNRADVNTVSRMLGHSSVKVTLDVYAHVMPGMQKEALSSLDGLF